MGMTTFYSCSYFILNKENQAGKKRFNITTYIRKLAPQSPSLIWTPLTQTEKLRRLIFQVDFVKCILCSHFTEPLFSHHNKASFELFFYYTEIQLIFITYVIMHSMQTIGELHGLHHEHMIHKCLSMKLTLQSILFITSFKCPLH